MKVWVAGGGMTAVGELWQESALDLAEQAVTEALLEANWEIGEVDLLVVGNMLLSRLSNQAHVGAYVAERLGYKGQTLAVEAACASGGVAIRQGLMAIRSGMATKVLVVGVEKMTDVPSETITQALMGAASEAEQLAGATFPSLYGMMHRAYQSRYALPDTVMAASAVKNHFHGSLNPKAHFQKPVTIEAVVQSALVADPVRLLHCSPISDGAAAVALAKVERLKTGMVELAGSGQGGDSISLMKRQSLTSLAATKAALHEVLNDAAIAMDEVGLIELHDCFSVAEMLAIEDMGIAQVGRGAQMLMDGLGRVDGDGVVLNSSGGLKAGGHPVGATGVKQVVEILRQLQDKAGTRQVHNLRVGMTHNVGGTGATAVMHILRRAA